MKRLVGIIAAILAIFCLSGCTVNWFGAQYDAPWYAIAIPIVIIFLFAHYFIMSATYVCPECGTEFKPKWYQLSAYIHFMGKRLIKCPNCHKTSYCKKVK